MKKVRFFLYLLICALGMLTACTVKATDPSPTDTKQQSTPHSSPSPTATVETVPSEKDLLLVEPVALSSGGF